MTLRILSTAFIVAVSAMSSTWAQPVRTPVAQHHILMLDGKVESTQVTAVQGGNLAAQVLEQRDARSVLASKTIANPNTEELVLEFAATPGGSVLAWINDSISGKTAPKSLSIMSCDLNGNTVTNREYFNALPTFFTMGDADASAKAPGKMLLKVKATALREGPTGQKCPPVDRASKGWMVSNFRFDIPGMTTRAVRAIRNLVVSFKIASGDDDGRRRPDNHVITAVNISNFSVEFGQIDLKTWQDWFETFVVQGRSSQQDEKTANIILFDQTMRTEIGRIELEHVGIFRMSESTQPNGGVKVFNADLYTENVRFELK